jgi:hypothetical protein
MTLRAVIAASAVVVAGLVSGCSHPIGLRGTPNAATASPVSLNISGPYPIAPGLTVSFVATATLSDGTTQDDARKVACGGDARSSC